MTFMLWHLWGKRVFYDLHISLKVPARRSTKRVFSQTQVPWREMTKCYIITTMNQSFLITFYRLTIDTEKLHFFVQRLFWSSQNSRQMWSGIYKISKCGHFCGRFSALFSIICMANRTRINPNKDIYSRKRVCLSKNCWQLVNFLFEHCTINLAVI